MLLFWYTTQVFFLTFVVFSIFNNFNKKVKDEVSDHCFDIENNITDMFAWGQTLRDGAAEFLFLIMRVKKERHGRTETAALETRHILHRGGY